MLIGRDAERRLLEARIAGVRDGLSAALVIRGESGMGKTALVDEVTGAQEGMQIIRVAGVEPEMELAFAGLHRLLLPFLADIESLPAPQRDALGAAFGLISGPASDTFLVGLGILTLMAEAASTTPLVCVVDDAQWLDQASLGVLAFVARRLVADSIAMFFCVRDGTGSDQAFRGISELRLAGLDNTAALALLDDGPGHLDRHVAERIIAAAAGNPLALTEFAAALSPAQLSGEDLLPEPLLVSQRLEEHYLHKIRALSPAAQTLLLLAAAEPSGDPGLLRSAASQLGLDAQEIQPEVAGFLTVRPEVIFRHPLIRSAVHAGASLAQRHAVHGALAAVTNRIADPDRWSWHLAAAAEGPDEEIAAGLERSAGRARARGGYAAESAFLARAAELTPDPGQRGSRWLAAAAAARSAGDYRRSQVLVEQAEPLLSSPLDKAQAQRIRGANLLPLGHPAQAPAVLAAAAKALEPFDARLTRDTWLGAVFGAWASLDHTHGTTPNEVATAALAAPPPPGEPTINDLMLDGLATRFAVGHTEAVPIMRRVIAMASTADLPVVELAPQVVICLVTATELWDLDSGNVLLARLADRDRSRGALPGLWEALVILSHTEGRAGRFKESAAYLAEAKELGGTVERDAFERLQDMMTQAMLGRDDEVREEADRLMELGEAVGLGASIMSCQLCLAIAAIGRGRYQEALECARPVFEADPPAFGSQILPELVEAAVRCDDLDTARASLQRLRVRAMATGSDWARGLLARSQALLASGGQAQAHYEDAIDFLRRSRMAFDQARAHLLYGEWLRREKRRSDAVEQLALADEMFSAMGAEGFAERAHSELQAAGVRSAQRGSEREQTLTPQEEQVARLAARGLTNREIATQLFISESTVAYHLRKVFRKLDVGSRRELGRARIVS